jgi:hypothetical protein
MHRTFQRPIIVNPKGHCASVLEKTALPVSVLPAQNPAEDLTRLTRSQPTFVVGLVEWKLNKARWRHQNGWPAQMTN